MTNEQIRFACDHASMFGYDPFVKKWAGKWFIDFAGLRVPTAFDTKEDAFLRLRECMQVLRMRLA